MKAVIRWTVLGGLMAFAAVGSVQAQQLTEGFDAAIPPTGWFVRNQSNPVGTTTWLAGNAAVFAANTGAGYIAVNYSSTDGANTISNWLITPQLTALQNGNTVKFFTRTGDGAPYADRLEVRLCVDATADSCGAGTSTGATATDVGTFTTTLVTVNPTLIGGPTGYPDVWTQFTGTLAGLPPGVNAGRIAFRYFVTDGGPAGSNSNYIGVDDVIVSSTVPVTLQNFSID